MTEIVFLKGLPASGKSTWAAGLMDENKDYKRVNKDLIREMLDFGEYSSDNEKIVLQLRDRAIGMLIKSGKSVIVDDCNFNPYHLSRIKAIADSLSEALETDIEVRIVDVDTDVEECIRRDSERAKPVGEAVIRGMAEKYLKDS